SIDNPPRYASGALHVGHAVHYTHIDFAARYRRMNGFNVFFPLCFDCNGIPIEERVEKKLGITRKDIDRHKFTKLCSEFANEKIEEMKKQFIILGESMDPSIYYQTDAENYRRLTQLSFIELYNKGLIYKGEHPINWCPRCMTALADAEIEYKNRETKLNYIKFKLGDEDIVIATTRPELLCTCQLVAIHPDDFRAEKLIGRKLKTPLFEKEVEIVGDKNVDPNFGSGVVMICSIGDKDDLEWIFKYKLRIEKGIDEEGRMTELCGKYKGMKVIDARKAIIDDMKNQGVLIKQEKLEQSIGTCWRCHTPVEFLVMPQWFLKTVQFKEKMLKEIEKLDWKPRFMKRRLQDWINSLGWDWVISRQRYFATPIPLWECGKCGNVVVAEKNECYVDPTIMDKECPKCHTKMKGCEDVFDTWMDSSISPLFNTYWERNPELFKKLYPMSLRPQAHDIIRTWAFYTILRGILLTDKLPFKTIMVDGFILSPDGKPMHTSLGNVIDPLKILEKYGTDAFRYYAATCSVGEDNSFREKDV
ncbi:MAG: valine--tRNA ligase, partial [Thermoplasmatales archaeon]|nr:valine--tRNA ligase [Thermoplasmatales archaeon]